MAEILLPPDLKDTARAAVLRTIRLLSQGFSGEIKIVTHKGGVKRYGTTDECDGETLANREREEAA